MGGGHGPRRNQPMFTFRDHSWPLYSIGQACTSPNVSSEQSKKLYEQISTKF